MQMISVAEANFGNLNQRLFYKCPKHYYDFPFFHLLDIVNIQDSIVDQALQRHDCPYVAELLAVVDSAYFVLDC
jgi:hypothetical protein